MTKEKFIGTWKLASFTAHYSNGEVSYPWGQAVAGRLMYDPAGNMSVQLMRLDRTRFESDKLYHGTPAEKQAAYEGMLTYFGTYIIDIKAGTVTHQVENSSFPNWVGANLVRFFEIGHPIKP